MGPINSVKVKPLLVISLLGILLIINTPVVNSIFVNFVNPTETFSTATVFVDPPHVLNNSLQADSKFTVHVNVSDVSDLFTWQVTMSWNSSILNVSGIIPGEFLARATEQTSSEALGGIVINSTDNGQGYGSFAESILGEVSGISGNGTLVSVEFLVLEYGYTHLNITVTGAFPTTLLASTGSNMTLTSVDGYFNNKILGDVDGDHDVDFTDFWAFVGVYPTDPAGNPQADFDWDGDVDFTDFWIFVGHYPTAAP